MQRKIKRDGTEGATSVEYHEKHLVEALGRKDSLAVVRPHPHTRRGSSHRLTGISAIEWIALAWLGVFNLSYKYNAHHRVASCRHYL